MTQPDQIDQLLLQAQSQADTPFFADVQPADNTRDNTKLKEKNSSSSCQWKEQKISW